MRAVRPLDGELADALQDRVHLVERAFGRLHERDAVLRVAGRLGGAADLGRMPSEIARPAASSAARLMRRPLESFSIDFDMAVEVATGSGAR